MKNKTKGGQTLEIIAYIIILLVLANMWVETFIEIKNKQRNGIPPTYIMYRLTSYYTGDYTNSGKCTASGICTNKFQVNDKGWYLYKNKLVMASGYEYQLYDELEVVIDGQVYQAIILDKCGACRKDTRLDLFINGKQSFIDRGYMGRNPIYVKL